MIYQKVPPDFDKRFDIVGCFVQYGGKFILLHRQDYDVHGNTWGLPAGKKEANETIEQAMVREAFEETGIAIDPTKLKYFSSLYVRNGPLDMGWHMFSIDLPEKPEVILNPREHSEFRWVSPAEGFAMADLIHDLKESIGLFYGISK